MTTIALPARRGGATRNPRGIRTWGIFVVLASLLAVMELAAACGTSQAPPQTGIEVVITTDNLSAPTDFNDISLQVSEKLADGGWNQLVNKDYPEPSTQNPFPATFAIGSGQSPDEQALVSVTAYQGGAAAQGGVPVVQRVAEVPLQGRRSPIAQRPHPDLPGLWRRPVRGQLSAGQRHVRVERDPHPGDELHAWAISRWGHRAGGDVLRRWRAPAGWKR